MKQSSLQNTRRKWKGGEPSQPSLFDINIKETMSYDIKMHGARFIITEFFIASILSAAVALPYLLYPHVPSSTCSYGVFWFGFSLNCLAILVQSLSLSRQGIRKEPDLTLTSLEISKLRRLTVLIGIVIVLPFATLIISLYQTLSSRN